MNRSLWGWSPPPLAADTPVKRLVDRWLPRTGFELIVFYAVIVLMLNFALHLPRRGELALDGTAALLAGAWCALNFWRCRHAHCVVTASGWLVLALLAFGEAGLGRSLIHGDEQLIFLAVLPVGVAFEFAWSRARGSNAIGGCLPA
ncbi:MAG TPA: hypothetical protein VF137_11625 [Candidatus Dormibacteraeota bacterium]